MMKLHNVFNLLRIRIPVVAEAYEGPPIKYADRKEWWRHGDLHREDGPAVEYADGSKEWRRNGHLHRNNGPAIEAADGYKAWYCDGKLHRDDGPAVEYSDGSTAWYRHGENLIIDEIAQQERETIKPRVTAIEGLPEQLIVKRPLRLNNNPRRKPVDLRR
jgi:hypothetical protein